MQLAAALGSSWMQQTATYWWKLNAAESSLLVIAEYSWKLLGMDEAAVAAFGCHLNAACWSSLKQLLNGRWMQLKAAESSPLEQLRTVFGWQLRAACVPSCFVKNHLWTTGRLTRVTWHRKLKDFSCKLRWWIKGIVHCYVCIFSIFSTVMYI